MSRISRIGDHIVIDLDKQNISFDGEEIHSFTSDKLLFSLIEYFCENANITLSIEKINSYVHKSDIDIEDSSVKNLVYRLRRIISKDKYPEFAKAIQTKPGGYMYTGSKVLNYDNTESGGNELRSPQVVLHENTSEDSPDNLSDTRSDREVIIDNMRKPLMALAEAIKIHEHETAEKIRSNEQFNAFRNDYDRILKYCIRTDPSAEPISIYLHDEIKELQSKWEFDIRKVSDSKKQKLMQDIISTLSEYTYYLSDKFMRVMGNTDRLIFKNQSPEDANLLRNELSPKTYELRLKLKKLYESLWPVTDSEKSDTQSETSSSDTSDNVQTTDTEEHSSPVVNQTVVNQYGDHPVHIDHVDTLNL